LHTKETMYESLYNQLHLVLSSVPKPNEFISINSTKEHIPVDFR